MEKELPNHLMSTYKMVSNAYGIDIEDKYYYAILFLLYDYMSDRNIVDVISYLTKKNKAIVLNDIYKVVTTNKPTEQILSEVRKRLERFGYQDWIKEE